MHLRPVIWVTWHVDDKYETLLRPVPSRPVSDADDEDAVRRPRPVSHPHRGARRLPGGASTGATESSIKPSAPQGARTLCDLQLRMLRGDPGSASPRAPAYRRPGRDR